MPAACHVQKLPLCVLPGVTLWPAATTAYGQRLLRLSVRRVKSSPWTMMCLVLGAGAHGHSALHHLRIAKCTT